MRIPIVVDANIILAALLGGKPSYILFDRQFQFISTRFTFEEVKKYFPYLSNKLGASREELLELLNNLPIHLLEREFYKDKLSLAEEIIGAIDKKDIEILALALKLETYLWSQDKHFEKARFDKLLKTYHFIK